MNSVKWVGSMADKVNMMAANQMAPRGVKESIDGERQFGPNPKRGETVEPTVYPLSPVKAPKKIKKLPAHLKVTRYGHGKRSFI